jgi:hypothetical protein
MNPDQALLDREREYEAGLAEEVEFDEMAAAREAREREEGDN